jgi:hypothetical protein
MDLMPVVDIALGAALVAMRQQFPFPPDKISDKDDAAALKAIDQGAQFGLRLATSLAAEQVKSFSTLLRARGPG